MLNHVTTSCVIAALSLGLAALGAGHAAQTDKTAYAAMAPVDQYLMPDRAGEIAQARAAAPPSISSNADVMVLGPKGYFTAAKGTNGFVCMVQRAWFSGLDDSEFWNPKERAPICFNPQAARSVLPPYLKRTEWAMGGMSKIDINVHTEAALAANKVPAPETGTIAYMLAKNAYHSDRVHGPWHPHLMFFLPRMNVADWGANLPASPVMGASGGIEPYTIFFVPVGQWSDGTPDTVPLDDK
jgi:hypothetical protein